MNPTSNPTEVDPQEASAALAQTAIADEFGCFSDWTERYQYLIDLGRKLPEFPKRCAVRKPRSMAVNRRFGWRHPETPHASNFAPSAIPRSFPGSLPCCCASIPGDRLRKSSKRNQLSSRPSACPNTCHPRAPMGSRPCWPPSSGMLPGLPADSRRHSPPIQALARRSPRLRTISMASSSDCS
jgi:hypothetical protein